VKNLMNTMLPSIEKGLRNDRHPEVSIIIPTLQEGTSIKACIESLLGQTYDRIGEVLVVDGGSTDQTREIVSSFGGAVRLLDNPGVTAASAMNIGIGESRSQVVVRIDAHSEYAPDYVENSVNTLLRTGATMVGGPMRPRGTSKFGNAVALVTSTPLAVGPGRFHYSEEEGEVDTVYLGTFFRVDIEALGQYDETNLQWAAEDQELNYRIRRSGGIVYLDPSIRSWYKPRSAPKPLAKQYRNYGLAKASTLRKHKRLPSWRPLAPALLLLCSVMGLVGGIILRSVPVAISVPLIHLGTVVVGAAYLTRSDRSLFPNSVLAVLICHWSYAFGFFQGIGRVLSRRSFDVKPKGGGRG